MYGEIGNSSVTISDVFKDKNPITFDYRMDPKGFFTIISESKDREIIVGRRKIRLTNNTKEKVDLRSATMVSFAKGKYFVSIITTLNFACHPYFHFSNKDYIFSVV